MTDLIKTTYIVRIECCGIVEWTDNRYVQASSEYEAENIALAQDGGDGGTVNRIIQIDHQAIAKVEKMNND